MWVEQPPRVVPQLAPYPGQEELQDRLQQQLTWSKHKADARDRLLATRQESRRIGALQHLGIHYQPGGRHSVTR